MDEHEAFTKQVKMWVCLIAFGVATIATTILAYNIADMHYAASDVHAVKRAARRLADPMQSLDDDLAARLLKFAEATK